MLNRLCYLTVRALAVCSSELWYLHDEGIDSSAYIQFHIALVLDLTVIIMQFLKLCVMI